MTGGESSHKDVDTPIVGLILFEVGVDHFEGVFIGVGLVVCRRVGWRRGRRVGAHGG